MRHARNYLNKLVTPAVAHGGRSIRTARLAGIGVIAVAGTIAGGYVALPVAAWLFVRALTLMLNGAVWLAATISSGQDAWTVAGTVATAAINVFSTPQVSGGIAALAVVGAVAIFGLQRLLGSEEESSR
jgi:hypothetical protein